MTHEQTLTIAADRLEHAATLLEVLSTQYPSDTEHERTQLSVLGNIIEAVAGIGETVRQAIEENRQTLNKLGSALKVAGSFALQDDTINHNPFAHARPCQPHQCPECGLPIGTNISSVSSAGCLTCNEAMQSHLEEIRQAKGTCHECNCPLGENSLNCNTCARAAYV